MLGSDEHKKTLGSVEHEKGFITLGPGKSCSV